MMPNKRTLQKTRTFQYKRSTTMDVQNPNKPKPPRSTSFSLSRRSSPEEYPTSPQLVYGDEKFYVSHPQHPLAQMDLGPDLFMCACCKEYGAGKRFTCRSCDFQLHDFCALAPHTLTNHPLHIQHQLLLNSKPVKGGKTKCDVCGKRTKWYSFKCSVCNFQMHPCCAKLSNTIIYPLHPSHKLQIMPSITASSPSRAGGEPPNINCSECRKKRSGKVYRCTFTGCDYHLHALCAKDMVNGLLVNNLREPGNPNRFGTAARLASQVVIDFLGGLIEGFGEGVGEVLVQSMTRSGRSSRTPR